MEEQQTNSEDQQQQQQQTSSEESQKGNEPELKVDEKAIENNVKEGVKNSEDSGEDTNQSNSTEDTKTESEPQSTQTEPESSESKNEDYGESYSEPNYKKQSSQWLNYKENQIGKEQNKENPDYQYIEELRGQLNSLKTEIYNNIIEKNDVPEELREFLPDDINELKSFLKTDKFKKLKDGVKAVNERQQAKEDAPQPEGPPTNKKSERPKPKTFEDLTQDDYLKFDGLFN